jgi:NAD(P)-dependent dehydrogenase (short-subunit alcohol dehydrogenase family)
MGQLDGKTAIVTGATSGIGARIAEVFVEQGARVLAAGRREEEGQALVARCGNAMTFLRTDVTDEGSVKALVDHASATFGRLDCLVNNAGSGSPMVSIADVTAADFDTVFATNVLGPMFGMKYAAPVMAKQGGGSIVTIASASGLRAGISGHIYSASKAAVIQLSRCVASELGARGVRLNTISPGGIVTGIFAKSAGLDGAQADRVAGVISDLFATVQVIPRAGQTDDIAQAAVYLASDAASFVTGHDLVVDGGLVPFCKYGFDESVEFRAEIGRLMKAELERAV